MSTNPIVRQKILVITGPTASGKSDLAIAMAKQYNGEIVSADSRQVYRGMDIGTGKVTRDQVPSHPERVERVEGSRNTKHGDIKYGIASSPPAGGSSQRQKNSLIDNSLTRQSVNPLTPYFSSGIPHYLLDIREPNELYNVTDFQRDARTVIEDILQRGKPARNVSRRGRDADGLPIICGGTGFWIQALVEDQQFPAVPPDLQLREELDKLSKEELFALLETLDPKRAETIDRNNPVRLIRAIEVAQAINKQKTMNNEQVPSPLTPLPKGEGDVCSLFSVHCSLIVALNPPFDILREKIKQRLETRFAQGMREEVERLHAQGVGWERLESFGLEYKWIAVYLQDKVDEVTMKEKLYFDSIHYAKRQLTWLRRWEKQGTNIYWAENREKVDVYINERVKK